MSARRVSRAVAWAVAAVLWIALMALLVGLKSRYSDNGTFTSGAVAGVFEAVLVCAAVSIGLLIERRARRK